LNVHHLAAIRIIGNEGFEALDFRLGFLGVRTPFCEEKEEMGFTRINGNGRRTFLKNHA